MSRCWAVAELHELHVHRWGHGGGRHVRPRLLHVLPLHHLLVLLRPLRHARHHPQTHPLHQVTRHLRHHHLHHNHPPPLHQITRHRRHLHQGTRHIHHHYHHHLCRRRQPQTYSLHQVTRHHRHLHHHP